MNGHCTQPSKPSEDELKIDLGWKEGFSQRFHKLSPAALDKVIASLLVVQYERGRQGPLDIGEGEMQKLCSAARCVSNTGSRAIVRFLMDFPYLGAAPVPICGQTTDDNSRLEMPASEGLSQFSS